MNLGLETDVANKNFTGAVSNPNDMLAVEFLYMEPINFFASEQKGVKVLHPREVYIRKAKPGDSLSIIERKADENDKQRFPVQWMRFQMQEGLTEVHADIPGWKLNEWPELNEDQVRFLTYQRFATVEQLAGASDGQIQGIGMGGVALREKAKLALRMKMDDGVKSEIAKRDALIEGLSARLEALEGKRETLGVPKK